jgi:cell division protein FtsB
MDDQYYRKAKSRPGVLAWLRKIANNKRIFLTLLISLPLLYLVTFSNKGILKRVSLENDKRVMEEKVRQAQTELQRLQDQSRALDRDGKAIEKVAREKYGMIRDGETVYRVKKEQ